MAKRMSEKEVAWYRTPEGFKAVRRDPGKYFWPLYEELVKGREHEGLLKEQGKAGRNDFEAKRWTLRQENKELRAEVESLKGALLKGAGN